MSASPEEPAVETTGAGNAWLAAEGKGGACPELSARPVAEQLAEAYRWAEALPEVKAETSDMLAARAAAPTAAPSAIN